MSIMTYKLYKRSRLHIYIITFLTLLLNNLFFQGRMDILTGLYEHGFYGTNDDQ
jgi:hypothetical protein